MTIPKLYKQFEEWVIKWKTNIAVRTDEFTEARVSLTFYYSIILILILSGSSVVIYYVILSNFTQSILEKGLDPNLAYIIISNTEKILHDRFIIVGIFIIIITILSMFLLTYKTHKPIKDNIIKQRRFIADASHDLRTPTAVIISGIEVALNNKKLDFDSAKKTLKNVLNEAKELSQLSNNLLNLSKYDSPTLNLDFKFININQLLKTIIERTHDLAKEREIKFKTQMMDLPIIVKGDKIELNRVFYNILDNAIKYSPVGSTVTVSDKIISDNYIIVVTDSGSGMSEGIIDRIFDPFYRTDEARTNTNGAGLGLTLAKKIIENHDGSINVKSQVDKGTSVVTSLPISSYESYSNMRIW